MRAGLPNIPPSGKPIWCMPRASAGRARASISPLAFSSRLGITQIYSVGAIATRAYDLPLMKSGPSGKPRRHIAVVRRISGGTCLSLAFTRQIRTVRR